MLSDYLDRDLTLRQIAIDLNSEHIPTSKGKKWSASGISVLFGYTIYYGYLVTNTKEFDTNGNIIGDKPEEEHIIWEAPELISKHDWDRLQEKLSSNSTRSGRPSPYKATFMLQGVLRCGRCGATIVPWLSKGRRSYVCRWHIAGPKDLLLNDKKKCSLPFLPAEYIEDWVYTLLCAQLNAEPEETYGELIKVDTWDDKIVRAEEEVENTKAAITRKERELRKIDALLADDDEDFDVVKFKTKQRTANQELKVLKRDLAAASSKLDDLKRAKEDQVKLAHLVGDEAQMRKLHLKIKTLPFEKKQRLIKGLLDGPAEIKLPDYVTQNEIATLDKNDFRIMLCNSTKAQFRYNQPILQDVLDLDIQLDNS